MINSRQSGFRKRHSTETILIKIIDDLLFELDKNRVSVMVLLDYSKALDMVEHQFLLHKLKIYQGRIQRVATVAKATVRFSELNN